MRTGPHERRRVVVADYGVLLVNENSRLRLKDERHLTVTAGEVVIDALDTTHSDTFIISTPQAAISVDPLGRRP